MKRTLFTAAALAAVFTLSACTDSSGARRALQAQGYTNIQITGWTMFGCGENDTYKTGFVATTQAGVRVEGVVCSGWLKGSTVRTF